jgi:hypothetical protein
MSWYVRVVTGMSWSNAVFVITRVEAEESTRSACAGRTGPLWTGVT